MLLLGFYFYKRLFIFSNNTSVKHTSKVCLKFREISLRKLGGIYFLCGSFCLLKGIFERPAVLWGFFWGRCFLQPVPAIDTQWPRRAAHLQPFPGVQTVLWKSVQSGLWKSKTLVTQHNFYLSVLLWSRQWQRLKLRKLD